MLNEIDGGMCEGLSYAEIGELRALGVENLLFVNALKGNNFSFNLSFV